MSGSVILLPDDHGSSVGANNISTIAVGAATFGAVEQGRNGTTITDRDYDWFRVYLQAGTGYYLQSQAVESNALNKPLFSLIDIGGNSLAGTSALSMARPNGTDGQVFQVATSGYYYVSLFSSCAVCTGFYGFAVQTVAGDDHLGGVQSTTALAMGTSTTGVVQFSGDRDGFRVELVAGKTYAFTADSLVDGTQGTLRDPLLRLLDANGKQLALNDDTSIGGESVASGASRVTGNSLIRFTATTSGSYYLDVSAAVKDMRGAYTVAAREIALDADGTHSNPDNWKETSRSTFGGLTVNGAAITGVIDHAGDRDWYRVDLDADVTYMLRVQATGSAGSIEDAVVRLFDTEDNDYEFITFNNTARNDPLGLSGPRDAMILFRPTVAGTYYIEASDAGNASGQYRISVTAKDDAAGNTSTIQKVLVNQRSVSGQIETSGDSDWYAVFLSEGVTYRLEARQTSVNGLADPYLNLRGLDGAALFSDDNSDGRNAVIEYTATRSGIFYLDVQDAGQGVGRYSVSVSAFDDDDAEIQTLSSALALSSATGRIDYGGDIDSILVELEAGQTYTLRALGAAGGGGLSLANPRILGLYSADGELLRGTANDDFGDGLDSKIRYRADRDGVYVLQVAGSTLADVGSYRVVLDAQAVVDVADSTATRSDLAVGARVSGVLESNTDIDWHRVQLMQGKAYVVELFSDVNDTQPLWNPKLGGVYGADGLLIAGTTQDNYGQGLNSRLVFTASATGIHYLEAAAGAGPTGAYQLSVRELAQTVDAVGRSVHAHGLLTLNPTSRAGVVEGTIDGAGDIDWYRVELQAGQRYEITLRGAASGMGSLLDPRLQGIYDAGGALVLGTGMRAGEGGTEVRGHFTPKVTGTYFLAAAGTAGGTGSFRLAVRETTESDDIDSNEYTRAVLSGGAFNSQIDELGDTDWIRVDLEAYSKVTFTLRGVAGSMGRLRDPYIGGIFDVSGDAVHIDRHGSTPSTSLVTFNTTRAGTYYVQAESREGRTGGYQLSAQQTAIVNLAPELLDPHIDHDPSTVTRMAGLVPLDGAITLQFGKPIAGVPGFYDKQPVEMLKGSGKIYIAGNGQQLEIDVNTDQVVVSGNTVTIKPNLPFLPDTEYGVIIDPGTFVDVTGAEFQGIGVARETIFTTIPAGELLTTVIIYTNKPASTFADTVKKQIRNELFLDPEEFIFRTVGATAQPAAQVDWHLMVYLAADNELEPAALDTLREMIAAEYGDRVQVSVLIDRAAGYDNGEGDWTGAYRGTLTSEVTLANIPEQWISLGEVNTGDAATLTNFINDARAAHPAKQHGLIIWGPGGGLTGTAWDDSAGMDRLMPAELSGALSNAGFTSRFTQDASDDTTSPLQVVNAHLTQSGSAVQLTFNYNLWDPSWQLLPYTDIDYSPAFQYSLDDGMTWQQVGSASIAADGLTLTLGGRVPHGTAVKLRYDADQRFTYIDSTPSGSPSGLEKTSTWGALLLADRGYFTATNSSVDTYFENGLPKANVVSAKDFNLTIQDARLSLLSLDSSAMGVLEILTEMQPHAHNLLTSQGEIASSGFDYTALLNRLGKASNLSGDQLAGEVIQIFRSEHAGTGLGGMSAFALDAAIPETVVRDGVGILTSFWHADVLQDIAANLSYLGQYMVEEASTTQWEFVREAAHHAISQPSADAELDSYRDLADFLQYLRIYDPANTSTGKGTIGALAHDALVGLDLLTLAASRIDSDSQGVGIYMPVQRSVSDFYNRADLDFLKLEFPHYRFSVDDWNSFVVKMQAGLTNDAPFNLFMLEASDLLAGMTTGTTTRYSLPEQPGTGVAARLDADLLIGTLSYSDNDAWTSGNHYTLSGSDAVLFRVVGDGLYLRRGVSLDYEGGKTQFSVTVSVSDANLDAPGQGSSKTFEIELTNQDENIPSFAEPSVSVYVDENIPDSTVIHTAQASDGDDPGTLSYSLKPAGDHGSFHLDAASGALTFKASPDYEQRDAYTVTIIATASAGQATEQVVTVALRDVADGGTDTRAPEIRTFSPADKANKVALNADIVLTFNEVIQRGTGDIVLTTLSGAVVETFGADRIAIDGKILTLDPTAQLNNNTGYRVSLAEDAVRDLAGNSLSAVTGYNFRTIRGIGGFATGADDTAAPTATYLPVDDAIGVALDTPIVLNFSEAIQRGTGNIRLVKYASDGTTTVVESFDAASSNRLTVSNTAGDAPVHTLTIDPTASLSLNTRYGLMIDTGAIVDAAGNAYVDQGGYDLTTGRQGAFNITLVYKDTENTASTGWTDNVKALFEQAVEEWEKVIVGDLPDMGSIDDLLIEVYDKQLPTGNLGSGGFSALRASDQTGLPYRGSITVDLSQGDEASLKGLILHEMGHVLGMGSLWGVKGLNSVFGQYTGERALKAYQMMSGDENKLYVPLETGGGPGTANVHWLEELFGNELMTGYQDASKPEQISVLTVAALADLGYAVNYEAADSNYLLAGQMLAPVVDLSQLWNGQSAMQSGVFIV